MTSTRSVPPLLLALVMLVAACGDDAGAGRDETAEAQPDDGDPAEVAALCDAVVDFHSSIIDSVNEMSSLEVDATPADRATMLADGMDRIITIGETTELPTEPASLTGGLADRHQQALVELRAEAADFRASTTEVGQDDRLGAVNSVFLLAEKLMSETEPRVTGATPDSVIEAARTNRSCRFVVQLPQVVPGN